MPGCEITFVFIFIALLRFKHVHCAVRDIVRARNRLYTVLALDVL